MKQVEYRKNIPPVQNVNVKCESDLEFRPHLISTKARIPFFVFFFLSLVFRTAILDFCGGFRWQLVPRLPFPVPRSPLPVPRFSNIPGIIQGSGACKHWFQYLISVYQLLVTLWLVNFDSFTSTLTLHTWLQTNMVSVCNLPSPHILTFWYEEVGGLRYLKRISQVLCLSSRCFSLARFFATRPFSSLACTDREHGTG